MYRTSVHSPDCKNRAGEPEKMLLSHTGRVIPVLREQLLKEYVLGIGDAYEMFGVYCKAFGVDEVVDTRMIILRPVGAKTAEAFISVKNAVTQYMGDKNILLNTVINDFLLIITTVIDKDEIIAEIEKVRSAVKKESKCSITAVYSKVSNLAAAPSSYEHLQNYIGYYFYSGSDVTVYENDIKTNKAEIQLNPDYNALEHAVNSGDRKKLGSALDSFFSGIEKIRPVPEVAKAYCLELYVCLIRGCGVEKLGGYMKGIFTVQNAVYLSEIRDFIERTGMEIADMNAPASAKIYSSLIRETISIIDENIENENLSLRWLAGTVLYTNVDYLGKLFKKETGRNFSHYVMEKRMEMAKGLILEGKKDRIYEVAEKVGYGSNSQYFSQVFKKYTGVSPLEYREFARLEREKLVPKYS